MNYIILNDSRSNNINGLLIQKLPPITKPLMRTQVDLIDGRDGDIVTNLGYAPVDKEITIGLHGNYDVDDAIRYFDSKGTVIFSNEPDKFYYYQIIEQIDFEKLIRFKTATVKFHCQPFKYSAVDRIFRLNNQHLNIPDYTETKNGITVTAKDGEITVRGTGSEGTEFMIPVSCNLTAGDYTLHASAGGRGQSACVIRLMRGAHAFGEQTISLIEGTVAVDDTVSSDQRFDYLMIYVDANRIIEMELGVDVMGDGVNSLSLFNRGNICSKPILTIYGSGNITLSLNGKQIFIISLGAERHITIDSAQMNAYRGDVYLNRRVIGDYENLALPVGTNEITWTGDVSKVIAENFSRWR